MAEERRRVTKEERQKFAAEALKAEAETKKVELEAQEAAVRLRGAQLQLEEQERVARERLASNKYHRVYHFRSSVNDSSVASCMEQLNAWHRNEPGEPIEIIFTSPGGLIIEGMALFDHIQRLRDDGHYITTVALGMAASMAGILLQAGTRREIGREAYVLIHQVTFGAYGKIGEVEDEVKFVHMIQDRVLDIFAARAAEAGRNGTASKPMTRAGFKRNWERKDWWISSKDCLNWGIVDAVR